VRVGEDPGADAVKQYWPEKAGLTEQPENWAMPEVALIGFPPVQVSVPPPPVGLVERVNRIDAVLAVTV
jgi:hypothetical protein